MNKLAIVPIFAAWAATLLTSPLPAEESEEVREMRIKTLTPSSWVHIPLVEPAIPADYAMKEVEISGGVVWGAKEDLEAFDPESVKTKRGLFYLCHSLETLQTGPDSFNNEFDENCLKELSAKGYRIIEDAHIRWDDYPVRHLKIENPDKMITRRAWIGLNTPDQWVMDVIYFPSGKAFYDDKIWSNFLNNTKKLEGQKLLLALGTDLQDGYTIYNTFGMQIKAIAEKRASDGKIGVFITPLDGKTRFSLKNVSEGEMPEGWRSGEHLTVIEGEMSEVDDQGGIVLPTRFPVLTKFTDSFSFDTDPKKVDEKSCLFIK